MVPIIVRGRVFNYSHTIGAQAAGGPGFRFPVDLALGRRNTIYVVNRGHDGEESHRVSIITTDSGYIGQFGSFGEGDGQFIWPGGVAVDGQGLVYVADEWLNRISIYDGNVVADGQNVEQSNFLRNWGTPGTEEGFLGRPGGLALDLDGNLYISEGDNHRVSKFTKDGEFLGAFGSKGSGLGEFNMPWGITIDRDGCVYVADWRNHRVQKLTTDGKHLATFGIAGDGLGKLHLPSGVAVDTEGDVYVTDWWQNKLEIYDSTGMHLATLIGDAADLSKWGERDLEVNVADKEKRDLVRDFEPEYRFMMPTAVAVDNQGHIFVVDSIRFRIQIYHKSKA